MPLQPRLVDKRKSIAPSRKIRKDDDDTTDFGRDEFDDLLQQNKSIKPPDQLDLTEQELKEDFTRILTANNPHAPQNVVRYSFKERQYKGIGQVDQLAVHFLLEGGLVHKDSDEGAQQLAKIKLEQPEPEDEGEESIAETKTETETDYVDTEFGDDSYYTRSRAGGARSMTNQFNFCDRATQTSNNPYRNFGSSTEPPPRQVFTDMVTQATIHDAYMEDYEKQLEKNKEKKHGGHSAKSNNEPIRRKLAVIESQYDDVNRLTQSTRTLERMVNLNTFDEIAQDFRYWEDPSDEYRDHQGTLLPLWKFSHDKTRKLVVTSIAWSRKYKDLFFVGHGSYDFLKQDGGGVICGYSLKNPSHPEFVLPTESGVLSLDVHPELAHMLCTGFYDGTVAVYNVAVQKTFMKQNSRGQLMSLVEPQFRSSVQAGKHTDPCWEVRWQKDDVEENLNFCSVSADGRVVLWTLLKNQLSFVSILSLKKEEENTDGPDGTRLEMFSCGTCFDFHRTSQNLYLVGTEDGLVHKCSKAYSSQFLGTLTAHQMAVYKVTWNPFHSDVFMTCSADWTIKIWDNKKPDAVLVYDLGSPVNDVTWAPYSSTVLAAVTADGRVVVFDLAVNKYEPICDQVAAQKKGTMLTHVSFNPLYPVLIVGDDRGHSMCLKLSPNLRKVPKDKKSQEMIKNPELEIQKLEKLMALVY